MTAGMVKRVLDLVDAVLGASGEASAKLSGSCDPDNFVRISGTPRIPASYDPIKLSS